MPCGQPNFNELLLTLYAAACGEDEWTPFLSLLGRAAGTDRVHITYVNEGSIRGEGPWDGKRQWIRHVGLSDEALADAVEYGHEDPWWSALMRGPFPEGWVGRGYDLKPIEEMTGSEYYEKVIRKHDFVRPAIAVLMKRPGEVAACGMARGEKDEEFGDDVLELLRELNPHMRMAIRLFNKTGEVQQNLDSVEFALEQFAVGVFVVDNTSTVIFANATARRQLESGEGLAIEDGKVKATSARESAQLRGCIQRAIEVSEAAITANGADRGIGVAPISSKHGGVFHAFVTPWLTDHQVALRKPAAVLLVTQPEGRIPRETWLETLYGLTKAESRIAVLVGGGLDGPETAEKLGLTAETVRTRLKTVFSKTNTRRQSDLARLMSSLPRG